MASIYQFKSRFQAILRPMVNQLANKGITANQVTIAAVFLSAMSGLIIALWPAEHWPYLLLPFTLFMRMALNAIDGMLAREHHMQSKLGAFLNELGDVISDTLLYLPFALIPSGSGWMVVVICLLAIITEMTGLIAIQVGGARRYDGPMGKSDRALAFGFIALLLGFGVNIVDCLLIIFYLIILLLIVTIYNRTSKALREAAHE